MKKLLISIIALGSLQTVLAGGGWPQPKNRGYFKVAQNYIRSPFFFSPSGRIVDITTVQLFTTSFYGEYGITDRLTTIGYFPLFVRNTLNEIRYNQSGRVEPGDSFNAIGDSEIGFKYGWLTNKPVVISTSVVFGLPLGKTAGGMSGILQTGDGEFNQVVRVDASHSFYPKPVYVSVYGGFNNRTRGFSDEVRFGAEIGWTLKKIIPILKLNVVQSLFNGDAVVAENGIFSNNTEYVSPTVEVNYQISTNVGVSGSGGFAFSGRNILAAPNWSLGVYLKL